jgi:hypothetical protein
MATPSLLAQCFARDPRKLVRFPDLPLDSALAELRLLEQSPAAGSKPESPATAANPLGAMAAQSADSIGPALAGLATHVWRTRGKLVDPVTNEAKEETRRALRHVEAALESLAQMGVTMNDWIGQPYDPGLPVKVITFDPTPGIVRDTVVEAVRPTVIWREQLLQLGEVIVGIPPNSTPSK